MSEDNLPEPPYWVEEESDYMPDLETFLEYFPMETMNPSEKYALEWLSRELKISYLVLRSALEKLRGSDESRDSMYLTWYEQKRGNGMREINQPRESLMYVQHQIANYLRDEFERDEAAFGFSGGSIEETLRPHLSAKWIMKVDFKDAFPSVSYQSVMGTFLRYYSWYVSRMLASLTTYKRRLPQGAPTSPRVFDIVCTGFDRYMRKLVRNYGKYGAVYTRYADNIFVSVATETFPRALQNGVLKAIENQRSWGDDRARRVGPSFEWHKLSVRRTEGFVVRALGLNIINGKLHNTRKWKRKFRMGIVHVERLMDRGLDYDEAWRKLEGMLQFAQEDTLPEGLLDRFNRLYEESTDNDARGRIGVLWKHKALQGCEAFVLLPKYVVLWYHMTK